MCAELPCCMCACVHASMRVQLHMSECGHVGVAVGGAHVMSLSAFRRPSCRGKAACRGATSATIISVGLRLSLSTSCRTSAHAAGRLEPQSPAPEVQDPAADYIWNPAIDKTPFSTASPQSNESVLCGNHKSQCTGEMARWLCNPATL